MPLNPIVGGICCDCRFLLPAPPLNRSRCGLSLPTVSRCSLRGNRCGALCALVGAARKAKEHVIHERVGAVSRHAPALSFCFGRDAVPVPPNTKPKRYAGFLMDRYWTEDGQGESIWILKYPFSRNVRTLTPMSQQNRYHIHFKGRCIIISLDSTISKLLTIKIECCQMYRKFMHR